VEVHLHPIRLVQAVVLAVVELGQVPLEALAHQDKEMLVVLVHQVLAQMYLPLVAVAVQML
jgi:hypothetical protein